MAYILKKTCFALCLTALLAALGCESSSPAPKVNASAAARAISDGVGVVQKTSDNGSKGPVFVFEEVHTSRIGQLQIAIMLLRLHDKYGLKRIGLEGGIWSGRPLDSTWYQNVDGSGAKSEKEDVAVRMVAQGEISSSELMAMLFPDVEVYGVEDVGQYGQTPNTKGSPEVEYLLAISEKSLSSSDLHKVEALLKQKKNDQAFEYMLTADPWVKEQYDSLRKSSNVSSEQLVGRLRGIQDKARQVGARISPQAEQDMASEIQFLTTASARSNTMVQNTLRIPGATGGVAVAMIVGAAHADRVAELLTQQGASFAVIRPVDLDSKVGSMTAEEYERKAGGKWARNNPGTLGHVLNSHRKPPPIVERTTGQSYASMQLASVLLARGARSGGPFPDDVWPQLANLPGLRVDRKSITKDGYDVIFRAWLKQDDGGEKEVWARVGTVSYSGANQSLEQKLESAVRSMKGEGGGGGKDGGGKGTAKGEGEEPPEGRDSRLADDMERKGSTISRVGMDTLAVYGASREDVKKVGKISI
jgi:hypothetical protein